MNKYQEALDYIKEYMDINNDLYGDDNISHFNKVNVDTLQELIDMQTRMTPEYRKFLKSKNDK